MADEKDNAHDDDATDTTAKKVTWATKVAPLIVAVLSSLATYTAAGSRTGEVKDKAESGYQFVKQALTEQATTNKELHDEIAKLTVDIADLRRRMIPKKVVPLPPPKVALPAPPPAAPALPGDLDKALAQQKAQAQQPAAEPAAAPAAKP